jgi:glycerate kinase
LNNQWSAPSVASEKNKSWKATALWCHDEPVKIAIAPNAFKGSLTAAEAAACIERGLRRALRGLSIVKLPMADGGDGTLPAIVAATGGQTVPWRVSDPLGRSIRSVFGVTGDGRTAVIEMALASGLALLKPSERNPMLTTSRGTGELIRAALDRRVREIVIGIGGSATNDGGMGLARALGARFLDGRNRELPDCGGALGRLARIDVSGLEARLKQTNISVACDVDNPLCGPRGAARVYGPQKGATPAMVKQLDAGLKRLAAVMRDDLGVKVADLPGAGAAGGLGAGLVGVLNARLRPGVDVVTHAIGLEGKLTGCDLVITGEGRLDGQTIFGKAPAGVARIARKLGIPVIGICGSLGPDANNVHRAGIAVFFSALEESVPEAELPKRGPGMLERCAEQVGRLLALKFTTRA